MVTTTTTPADFILDWWSFAAFAGSLVVGFLLGTAKQRWTQEELQKRVVALEARLDKIAHTMNLDSRDVLVIKNEITHMAQTLADIKAKLEA
jgi:uncharacterized membrane-anchored protein YhcB (DUF1043 family)